MTAALVIFTLTYLSISVGWLRFLHLDRPAAALCGAVAMVAAGVLDVDAALGAIDLHVIVLLFGVMVIAAYLIEARFFRYTAWLVLTRTRSARSLLWSLVLVAGGLSALLVNDTVCLVLTPLVVAVVAEADLPPLPYLFALAGAANVGGVVSFSGNPQNMMIGRAAAGDPGYAAYLIRALPAGAVALVVLAAVLTLLFRRELPAGPLPPRTAP
ncbi:MAG TPA: SLC13 family permease, partial [Kofleriaceae bacterium]|nr:SLC13 family permease [Kofleriaceae bacterium]